MAHVKSFHAGPPTPPTPPAQLSPPHASASKPDGAGASHATIDGTEAEALDLARRMNAVDLASLYGGPDAAARARLLDAARALIARLEAPFEHMWNTTVVPFNNVAILRVTADLGLWAGWRAAGGRTASLAELLRFCETECSENLLRRCLRHLAASHIIEEAGVDLYRSTPLSLALGEADTPTSRAIVGALDHALPSSLALPAFLAKTGYAEPLDGARTSYMDADPDGLTLFARCRADPARQKTYIRLMEGIAGMKSDWTRLYDTDALLRGYDSAKGPLVVDVAGCHGRDLLRLLDAHPGRSDVFKPENLVLEDLPDVIAMADPSLGERMRVVPHDFFAPQPVKGARAYYFHTVLHDWSDDDVRTILGHTAAAMIPGYSKLLVHEVVLLPQGTSLYHASVDCAVMHVISAAERTEQAWRCLLESAGFRVLAVWTPPGAMESVVEAELA